MRLLMVAGEASGDLHAANLLAALRRRTGSLEVFGVGGERLRAAGIDCVARAEELSVMGLAEVVRDLPRLAGVARRVRREALQRRPDVAVLVDSPDFNLRLARHLHRARIPVVVYVSPQLWAWRQGRVRQIRRHVAKVLCILPFEVEFYARHGVDASYVGHPLLDELQGVAAAPPGEGARTVALLPGSRWHEVTTLLPTMLAACHSVAREIGELRVRLLAAPGLEAERLRQLTAGSPLTVDVVTGDRVLALAASTAALVASGTATLECAILGVPMAVCYRLHPVSYLIARLMVKVPHVSLVNLVAGEGVVPEFIQGALTAASLAATLRGLLGEAGERQRRALAAVRQRLGDPGASDRAAAAVLEVAGRAGVRGQSG